MADKDGENQVIIRRIANRVNEKYRCVPPIDVVKIGSSFAQIEEIDYPAELDAIYIPAKDNSSLGSILIKPGYNIKRKRFSIAHEIGHHFIPWHAGTYYCEIGKEDVEIESLEREADQFAAELLMPYEWMKKRLHKYQEFGELIEIVSREAQTSYQSTIYRLISIMPDGYVMYINDKVRKYSSKKFSGNVKPIYQLRKSDGTQFFYEGIRESFFSCDSIDVCCCYFGRVPIEELLPSGIERDFDTERICVILNNVFTLPDVSVLHVLGYLAENMNDMVVIYFKDKVSGAYQFVHSIKGGTYYFQEKVEQTAIEAYCFLARESRNISTDSCEIIVWEFSNNFSAPINGLPIQESKSLIKEIIADVYLDDEEAKAILCSINGIIGSMNNDRKNKGYSYNEFYNRLMLKFSARRQFGALMNDPRFRLFVAKKAKELCQ